MRKLEMHEKNAIRLAQRKTKRHKENGGTITCPFIHTIDSGNIAHDVCVLCHKWMGTNLKISPHPCNQMTHKTISKRFWRDPDDEYSIIFIDRS